MKRASLYLILLAALGCAGTSAQQDKAPGVAAPAKEAGTKQYREGLHGVDFTGLDSAQQERALDLMNAHGCDCGCGMTIAQCRVEDKTCPRSPGLAADVLQAVRAGKSDAQIAALLKPEKAPVQPSRKQEIDIAGSPFKGPEDAAVTVVTFEDFQ